MTSPAVRIAQLSDTHFLEEGGEAEGGFSYDTSAAFDAVRRHSATSPPVDLVVVTGDIADHGRPEQYRRAALAFEQFGVPVNVCPGNHDQDAEFNVGMGRPSISTTRVIEAAGWCFLFVDSNSGTMIPDSSGRSVDPDNYEDRLHNNGSLGLREAQWIQQMHDMTEAEHVFIWVHHPPGSLVGLTASETYAAEWTSLLPALPKVRGFGAGHTHVPLNYEFLGRQMYVCPALKNNFDLEAKTLLPPGYRTYGFAADGTVQSEVHLIDDDQWPRHPMGRAAVSLLNGELTWDQFNAIVARKRASLS